MLKTRIAEKAHAIGTNHTNTMAHKNGLDDIDLWAMGIGAAERKKHELTHTKKHTAYLA